jgi:hypothetical protein
MTTLLKKDYQYSSVLWEEVMQRVQEIIRDEYNVSPYVAPTLNLKTPSPFRIWTQAQGTETLYAGAWHKEYTISINHYLKTEDSERFYRKVHEEAERLYQLFFNNQGTKSTEILGFFGGEPQGIQITQEGEYFRIEVLFSCQVFRADDVVYVVTAPSEIRARTRAIEASFNFWSLDFDGTDDQINCGSDSSLDNIFDGGGSVSLWFNPTAQSSTLGIIKKANVGGWNFDLADHSGGTSWRGKFVQSFDGDNYQIQGSSRTFSIGNWYNVVIVYNSSATSNTATIYVNGEVLSITTDSTPSGTRHDDSSGNLLMGDTGSYEFSGQMSEAAIFNSVLSSSEIEAIYNNGQPLLLNENQGSYKSSSNLVAYYRMGSGSGDDRSTNGTIIDQSVNTNNGTMTNFDGLDFKTNVPQIYDKALFSNSLVFDGTDDYLDLGDKTTSLQSNGFTFSAWIYPHDLSNTQFFISGDSSDNNIRFNGNGYQLLVEINGKGTTFGTWASDSDSVFVVNEWQHLVVTYNNGTVIIYRNGNPVIYDGTGATSATTTSGATEFKFRHIGKRYGVGAYYNGGISDMAIYNTDLDATNVTAMYNSGKPIDLTCDAGNYNNTNNIVGYWKMGDGYLDELPSSTNQGVIFDQVTPIIDDDMVGNGDFSNSTSWTVGGGWAISGETLVGTSTVANANRTGLTITEGKAYKLSFEIISYTSGTVDLGIGGTNGTLRSAVGVYEEYIIAGSGANLTVNGGTSFTGVVDNVKAQLINGNPGLTNAMNASAQSISVPE